LVLKPENELFQSSAGKILKQAIPSSVSAIW
jgi:hypothetical protein